MKEINHALSATTTLLKAQPIRIQRSRKHKQTSPNGLPVVYVGRPGKYGNPYKVTSELTVFEAVALYKKHVLPTLDLTELRGKNLSCWCKVGSPCHGDELLRYLRNETSEPTSLPATTHETS